jgi:hypothetical protein
MAPFRPVIVAAWLQRETAWGESLELLAVHHRQNGCALEQVFGNPETFSANERQGTAKLCFKPWAQRWSANGAVLPFRAQGYRRTPPAEAETVVTFEIVVRLNWGYYTCPVALRN